MFISKKKYRQELNEAWTEGYDRGVYEGERKGRRSQITTADLQNYLGRYLVSNRPHNDNLLTRHASWVTRTKIYDCNPTNIYVWKECSECHQNRVKTTIFKVEDWNNYNKDHWDATNLPLFCEKCGCMMDEEDTECKQN